MADEQAPRPPAPPAAPSAPSGYAGQGSGGHSGPPSGGHSGPPRFGGPGGPRPQGGARPGGPAKRGKRNFVRKKKVCRFCVDKSDYIDYKRAEILAPFLQERGKILPRRMTGTCARHQRWLTVAIKRAQNIALLPFAAEL
jgi:small subunit ribosomal protein S18